MTVKEIFPNMLCLEYRQDESDEDYDFCKIPDSLPDIGNDISRYEVKYWAPSKNLIKDAKSKMKKPIITF